MPVMFGVNDRTSQVTQAMETRTLQAQEFQVPSLLEVICIALPGTKKEPPNQYLLTRRDVTLPTVSQRPFSQLLY